MRGRKNGASPSSPANGATTPALRPDESALDDSYAAIFEALRLWRRAPDDPTRKAALIAALDLKEDLLHRVAAEDARLAEGHPVVPG